MAVDVAAREGSEIFFCESSGWFDGAVGAKIIVDDDVASVGEADGFGVGRVRSRADDAEGWEILVAEVAVGFTESFDSFRGGLEIMVSFTAHEHVPAFLDHGPILFVTVGPANHTTHAVGDAIVGVCEGFEEGFDVGDVFFGGLRSDVATVEDEVKADAENVLGVGAGDEFLEVGDVTMDAAVAEDADEVEGGRSWRSG